MSRRGTRTRWLWAAASAYLGITPFLAVLLVFAGAGHAAPLCAPAAGGLVAGGPGGGPMTGTHTWSAEQTSNAHTITAVTSQRGLPRRAAVIAVAVAMQESRLRNLDHGDRDSVGLFQQRPSTGWGARDQLTDPVHATSLFLDALVRVPDWQRIDLWRAADSVQRSCCPHAYTQWASDAALLVGRHWTGPADPDPVLLPGADSGAPTPTTSPPCGPGGSGLPSAPSPGTAPRVPAEWAPPDDERLRTVVAFALDQLGKPYVWGGVGPDGWDCSGLTLRAWAAVGVALGRTTYDQVHTGTPVPSPDAVRPGDLLFIPGADGTHARPGHVGLALGHGLLVHAPQPGHTVRVDPLTTWTPVLSAIRRPT
ncbi:C40 family peptidase [Streptoalloteichus hindustanus]|uniref:Cell wall-associated hydrolase, NlpC family n=1 Tax=Streptoalloteichus hindustanus TaxID=2017 RepID=A0A1M5M932_STRHI|nr:C40 family peptidase [Streptoalloteichus hindustanus]SHG73741.1 Cell wall-associated hydrolase, NlpC family [Streptoalloteichus hindustanus]